MNNSYIRDKKIMEIAFFDFDNTITKEDTFLKFLEFITPKHELIIKSLILIPILMGYKLKLYYNGKAKEIVFRLFFNNKKVSVVEKSGCNFVDTILPDMINPETLNIICEYKSRGIKVVVVTASFYIWIKPWCDKNGLDLISTEFETINGSMTGRFKGKNCFGAEKVRRIKEKYDLAAYDKVFAYGDSIGDREMLLMADEGYLYNRKTHSFKIV